MRKKDDIRLYGLEFQSMQSFLFQKMIIICTIEI